jgi:hypothetical protein
MERLKAALPADAVVVGEIDFRHVVADDAALKSRIADWARVLGGSECS